VQRLSNAFICALICHLVLVLLPYPQVKQQAPQLTSDNSIRVSLASSSTDETIPDVVNREEALPKKESPPEQKKKEEEKIPVQEMAQAMPPNQEAVDSVFDKPETEKQLLPVEKIPHPSPPTTTQASHEAKSPAMATAVQVDNKAAPLKYSNPKPAYPSLARQQGYQGTVSLTIVVSKNGRARRVSVHKSSGHELLDNSALKTVRTWRFLPAIKNGRRVAMEIQVLIHFKLD
jgi:periplasmic protein TonB